MIKQDGNDTEQQFVHGQIFKTMFPFAFLKQNRLIGCSCGREGEFMSISSHVLYL